MVLAVMLLKQPAFSQTTSISFEALANRGMEGVWMNTGMAYRLIDSLFTLSEFRPYTFLLSSRADSLEKKLSFCKSLSVTQDDKIKYQDVTLQAGLAAIQNSIALLTDTRVEIKKLQGKNDALQSKLVRNKTIGGIAVTIALIEAGYILLKK